MPSDDTYSLSGDPLVGVAKDWAGKTPARELCMELFCRTLQLSVAIKWLCAKQGVTIDEAARRGAAEALEEVGLAQVFAGHGQRPDQGGLNNGAGGD